MVVGVVEALLGVPLTSQLNDKAIRSLVRRNLLRTDLTDLLDAGCKIAASCTKVLTL